MLLVVGVVLRLDIPIRGIMASVDHIDFRAHGNRVVRALRLAYVAIV